MSRRGICAAALLGAFSITGGALAAPRDQIRISLPAHVKKRVVYDVTVRGYSRRHATAYLFIDYTACGRSFAAESHRAPNEADHYAVKGRFAKVSGWKSSSTGIDHACAYLVATSSGHVLARSRRSFRIH